MLGRAPRTVSRESARNMARGQPSRACTAQTLATARVRQPRRPRKLVDPWLWQDVWTHRAEGCSPEQIAGRLQRASPTTCGSTSRPRPLWGLSVLPRGALRSALLAALRQARKARRPRARGPDRRGQIPHMTPSAERPAEVRDPHGARPLGRRPDQGVRNGSAVGTLVERTTRLVLLARMKGTDARRAREGFTKKLRHVPALLRKPRPYDRGKELAEHERLAQRLAIPIFVADPYSPWQRGTHETHQWAVAPVPPPEYGRVGLHPARVARHRPSLEPRPRTCLNVATPLEASAHLRHHSPIALGT